MAPAASLIRSLCNPTWPKAFPSPRAWDLNFLVLMQTVHIYGLTVWQRTLTVRSPQSAKTTRQRPAPQARVTMAQTMPSRPFTESQAARVTDSVEVMRRSCLSRRARKRQSGKTGSVDSTGVTTHCRDLQSGKRPAVIVLTTECAVVSRNSVICTFGGNSTNDCMPSGIGERARIYNALFV